MKYGSLKHGERSNTTIITTSTMAIGHARRRRSSSRHSKWRSFTPHFLERFKQAVIWHLSDAEKAKLVSRLTGSWHDSFVLSFSLFDLMTAAPAASSPSSLSLSLFLQKTFPVHHSHFLLLSALQLIKVLRITDYLPQPIRQKVLHYPLQTPILNNTPIN
jgi:hypothetical protein